MDDPTVGQRIRLLDMPEDPDPIPEGTMGTVLGVHRVRLAGETFTQIHVKWDDGRTLSLNVPPDRFEVEMGGDDGTPAG